MRGLLPDNFHHVFLVSLLSVMDLWYVLATAGDPHFPLVQTVLVKKF